MHLWQNMLFILFYLLNFNGQVEGTGCSCSEFSPPGFYFSGDLTSFILYNETEVLSSSFGVTYDISLEFQTTAETGVILFSHGDLSIREDFVAIYIRNGYIVHSINNFDATAEIVTSLTYNEGSFHCAQFKKERNVVSMIVDDESITAETGTSAAGADTDGQIYFGGLKNSSVASQAVVYLGDGMDVSFQGCIRDVTIDGGCFTTPAFQSEVQNCSTELSSASSECQLTTEEYIICGDVNATELECLCASCCWDSGRSLCFYSDKTVYHNGDCTYRQVYAESDGFATTCSPSSYYTTATSQDDCLSDACSSGSQTNAINLLPGSSCFLKACGTNNDGSISDLELTDSGRDIWVAVVAYCDGVNCQNGGSCIRTNTSYYCSCLTGYTGDLCETDIDDCVNNSCSNGATCLDGVNSYTCSCVDGYSGEFCETDIDECASNPCTFGGNCSDILNGYICDCLDGYNGTNCETEIDECSSNPCENDGSCDDLINGYACNCPEGYNGTHCEINIDECEENLCENYSTCVDEINGYTCQCVSGYTDTFCQTDINECSSDPCENAGICNDLVNEYTCDCPDGYTSTHCETDINECESNLCENSATCVDEVDGYSCICVDGYAGTYCRNEINECDSSPCENEATCVDNINNYSCECVDGYTDTNCETDIDECQNNQCENEATCTDEVNVYSCICVQGYTGTYCEIVINGCENNICENESTCTDEVNGYSCICVQGYTGTNCEIETNECESNPCENGATCIDNINSFSCGCADGYTGTNCETDDDECINSPCQSGATCSNLVGSFTCTCAAGYTGDLCETDENTDGEFSFQQQDQSADTNIAAAVASPIAVIAVIAAMAAVSVGGYKLWMKHKSVRVQSKVVPEGNRTKYMTRSNTRAEITSSGQVTPLQRESGTDPQQRNTRYMVHSSRTTQLLPLSRPATTVLSVLPATPMNITNWNSGQDTTSDIDGLASYAPTSKQAAVYHASNFIPDY